MLVKILDIDSHSWWLFDNLDKIRFAFHSSNMLATYEYTENFLDIHFDRTGKNFPDMIAHPGKYRICPDLVVVEPELLFSNEEKWQHMNFIISKNGDDEKCIVFSTLAFIMNDKGETIEKIPSIIDAKKGIVREEEKTRS